jgi:hypothetical protein
MGASKTSCSLLVVLVVVWSSSAQTDTSGLPFFTDAQSLVRGQIHANGIVTLDTSGVAYEGKQCIKYAYNLKGMWWDGFGLRPLTTLDATGMRALRLAYKGPASGTWLQISLSDADGNIKTMTGKLYGVDNWTVVELPMSDFKDRVDSQGVPNSLNFARFYELWVDIYNSIPAGAGTVYLDDIVFVGAAPNGTTKSLGHARMAREFLPKYLASGDHRMKIHSLNGAVISRIDRGRLFVATDRDGRSF